MSLLQNYTRKNDIVQVKPMPKIYVIIAGMVRLFNDKNLDKVTKLAYGIMHIQEFFTYIREINNPEITPCIYVMWHENQFSVYGIKDKKRLNILISNSADGEIISYIVQKMGFSVVRGSSQRKGAVSSTLQLIHKLNSGENAAIMVDGPRGPLHKVKSGAIKLAKETGAPIVPMHWYSEDITFVHFPSWDKMSSPLGPCRLINLYGKPIYVKQEDDDKDVADKIAEALTELERIAPEEYKKAKEAKLWKRK